MAAREPLRLPKTPALQPTTPKTTIVSNNGDLKHNRLAFSILCVTVALGTAYSVYFGTFLDTSDPLLAHLPHPSHHSSYFARKSNIFNQYFVKKAWGWTSLAFWLIYFTSPSDKQKFKRVWQWAGATWLWGAFTTWFFGPAIFDRLVSASGGECVIALPGDPGLGEPPKLLNVPVEYCHTRTTITTGTHPSLFATSLVLPPAEFIGRPRLYRGHDVSGHLFLLTLSLLFLVDQVATSLRPKPSRISQIHALALNLTLGLVGIWWWMSLMTSVYFHTPFEKLSGFVLGSMAFLLTQVKLPSRAAQKVGIPIPEEKLRPDAMKID